VAAIIMALVTPHGRDLAILISFGNAFVLATIFMRFYAIGHFQKRSLRIDDYLIIISIVSLLALDGTVFWGKLLSL
jgi:hypothetical protein